MAIYIWEGKILTEGNAIAIHEDCCCDAAFDCWTLIPCANSVGGCFQPGDNWDLHVTNMDGLGGWDVLTPASVQINFEDSEDCNGTNAKTQSAWGEMKWVPEKSGTLHLEMIGMREADEYGRDEVSIFFDDVLLYNSSSSAQGAGCSMRSVYTELDMAVTKDVLHELRFSLSTIDEEKHKDMFFRFSLYCSGGGGTPPALLVVTDDLEQHYLDGKVIGYAGECYEIGGPTTCKGAITMGAGNYSIWEDCDTCLY